MIGQLPAVKKQHLWLDVACDPGAVIPVPSRLTGWDPDTWTTVTIEEIYKLTPRICATLYADNDYTKWFLINATLLFLLISIRVKILLLLTVNKNVNNMVNSERQLTITQI